ncbi:protein kinase, partial [Helicosporidium sp. ATCC 50920]
HVFGVVRIPTVAPRRFCPAVLVGRGIVYRSDSLRESKVLMVNDVRRTDSVLHPDLFQYQNHFEFISLIGQTQTSELTQTPLPTPQVFKVRHQATGELFAVKRSKRRFRSKLQRERCLREVRAVSSLPPHPNLVSQHRAWQESGHFYIQMDLCEGGNLHQAVAATKGRGLPDAQAWQVAHDVAAGLSFLHASGILHLDIKPENIYRGGVAGDSRWRIGDFGLAVANECADWEEGDGNYVAPELLLGSDPAAP